MGGWLNLRELDSERFGWMSGGNDKVWSEMVLSFLLLSCLSEKYVGENDTCEGQLARGGEGAGLK